VADRDIEKGFEIPASLTVGMAITTDPEATRGLLDQFCEALSDATGVPVKSRAVWHYHHLLDGLADREIDILWLPPIVAMRAAAVGRVIPIALPLRNGSCFYRAVLFARRDSPLETVADLDGVRAAWVDRQSASGYLGIRAHLIAMGLELEEVFGSDLFLGTHDGVSGAVRDGEADVGATFCHLDESKSDGDVLVPQRGGWGETPVRLLSCSAPIPSDVMACDNRLPSLARRLVQSALIESQNSDLQQAARALLGAEGFVIPKDAHLAPLRGLLEALGASSSPHSLFPAFP